uniref:Odorant receptor n=2 Tax=Lutzomyia longipalpis TaxID=7200 RepID=A0A240SXY3_LUTLO
MSPQLDEFNRAKPKIDFLIAHLTLNVASGPLKNRSIVTFLALFNLTFIFFFFLHLKNSMKREINFNFLTSLLIFIVITGYEIRIFIGLFKNYKMKQFVSNINDLYQEQEEDKELGPILRKHLVDSLRICQLWLMYDIPFIASDSVLWKVSLYILQGAFLSIMSSAVISMDTGILYLGLQIIAELNILTDYMKLLNEKIKTDPKFLRKIIKRHCSIIENNNLLNEIISETSSMQLIFSFLALLFGFTFLIKYTTGMGNYLIILGGGGLGLPICILGEFLKVKTDKLSDTFYLINWYELSLNDQKTFLINLRMAQREYGLKAAGMYDVNLYTFVQVRSLK